MRYSFPFSVIMAVVAISPFILISGCKTLAPMEYEGCPKPDDYYQMTLWEGDYFSVTLESKLKIKTPKGSRVTVPVNNIKYVYMQTEKDATVYFCDDMRVSGEILNEYLYVKFSSTGKKEKINISKIERLVNVEQRGYAERNESEKEEVKEPEIASKEEEVKESEITSKEEPKEKPKEKPVSEAADNIFSNDL